MLNFFKRLFQSKETKAMSAAMKKRMTKPELRSYIEESVRRKKACDTLIFEALKREAEQRERARLDMRMAGR